MALYTRLIGTELPKIRIHSFTSAMDEWARGFLTAQEVIGFFDLDASEQTQAQSLVSIYNQATDKVRFMRVFKDCLYLAEQELAYTTQAEFVQRLNDEITAQNG